MALPQICTPSHMLLWAGGSANVQSSWVASVDTGSRESSGRRSLVTHSFQSAWISGLFGA